MRSLNKITALFVCLLSYSLCKVHANGMEYIKLCSIKKKIPGKEVSIRSAEIMVEKTPNANMWPEHYSTIIKKMCTTHI